MSASIFFPVTTEYVSFMLQTDRVCRRHGIVIEDLDKWELLPVNRKIRYAKRNDRDVVLKFVARYSTELDFLLLLNSNEHRRHPKNYTIELLDHFPIDDDFDCLVMPSVLSFNNDLSVARLSPVDLHSMAQQVLEYSAYLQTAGLVHRDLKLENVGFRAANGPPGIGPGARLVVLDLGRMERRFQSDLVQEFYVPREYCPPEFFESSKGCDPFMMDAYAAGVIAAKLEAKAKAKLGKMIDFAGDASMAKSAHVLASDCAWLS